MKEYAANEESLFLKRFSFIQNSEFTLRFFFSAFLLSFLFACSSTQLLTKKEQKKLHSQIIDSPVFSKSQTGFALYDPVAKEMLYEQDADIQKYLHSILP